MKKSFTILMVLVITFFTVPFGGLTVLADEKVYDDIADGKHEIIAKALHATEDKASGAAGFIAEDAILSIQDGEIKLTITVLHNEMAEIEGLQIEGNEPESKDEETGNWTYKLGALKTELVSQVQYAVPAIGLEHDVPFRFILEGLDGLPVKEEEPEEPQTAPEERVVGDLITVDEADAVYKLEYETDSNATRAQLLNPVTLLEKNDKQFIQIPISERGANFFRSLEINGEQVTWNSIEEGPYIIQFELPESIEDTLTLDMVIQAGPRVMPHNDIKISFNKDTIETIKETEEEQEPEDPKPAPEERVVGDLITVDEADAVYELEYETDSNATRTQLLNPVTLLKKNNKQYIQIPVNERGANFFRSLEINGDQVTWNSITEGPYIIQFELPGSLEDTLTLDMVIQAGPNAMPHDDIKLSFAKDTLKKVVALEKSIAVEANEKIKANDTEIKMPDNLPKGVNVGIRPAVDNVKNTNDLEIAGEVYEFNFDGLPEDFEGTFELVMGYNADEYDAEQVDIYYYNELTEKWEPQDGTVADGKITVQVEHFSTYGVFAKEADSTDDSEESDETEESETPSEPVVVPEDAAEIDYVIMHEDGDKESTANSFFVKPGLLFEIDGKQYVEVTITNGDMVQGLSTFETDAVIVKENADGSIVVQFQVNDDLSETLLKMKIVVPGVYDTEHSTFFVINDDEAFEEEDPSETEKPETPKNPETTPVKEEDPDNAYEINYEIVNENKTDTSAADRFFEKPALLLEKDGKTYMQVTINNGDLVEGLSTEYGEAVTINTNADGSIVVQFIVNNDLTDTLLNMTINVPGLYKSDYKTYIVFDQDSKVEVDVDDNRIEIPEKPEFGNGDSDTDTDSDNGNEETSKSENNNNPQTGDTTNILLYSMLLIGSLIPLAVKLRRRFV